MDEEKKTGLADAVETGASAAHTIKGAIKAGKAISGAAKGAAAGGPYGAVAGAVWAGRKHIGKIIAVIIILLLLPVLFILMLPGLKRSEQLWDLSIILNEASRRAGAGGPFWIIG